MILLLNKIFLMGRMTRDPELRHTASGTAVANFTLAVERDFKDKQTGEKATDFIECIAWRGTAETISRYFTKGRMAVVIGSLQLHSWMDKEGNKRRAAEVVVESIYFGDSKKSDEPESQYRGNPYNNPSNTVGNVPGSTSAVDSGELDDGDGDLPF